MWDSNNPISTLLEYLKNLYGAPNINLYYEWQSHSAVQLLTINLLKPTGHVMHQQFNIQQLYALPTLYLCVLYLSESKQRLVPLIS